jgi:hypothetical protein
MLNNQRVGMVYFWIFHLGVTATITFQGSNPGLFQHVEKQISSVP